MRVRALWAGFAFAICAATCIAAGRVDGPTKPAAADPAAISALKEAHDMRDVFPDGFPGITADVAIDDNGTEAAGTLTYSADGKLTLDLKGASKQQEDWAREELGTALSHRRQTDFARTEGGLPLTFAEDDHCPLGRKIALNDKMNSYYRLKDNRIAEVTRSMGPMRFTITVLENKIVEHGKYLPTQFVVTFFDPKGGIQQMQAYTDTFTKVGGAWVPSTRRVVSAENGAITARTFALSNVRLLSRSARR